jgi:hypothetical protein
MATSAYTTTPHPSAGRNSTISVDANARAPPPGSHSPPADGWTLHMAADGAAECSVQLYESMTPQDWQPAACSRRGSSTSPHCRPEAQHDRRPSQRRLFAASADTGTASEIVT